jgi:hypothetical protein
MRSVRYHRKDYILKTGREEKHWEAGNSHTAEKHRETEATEKRSKQF